MLINKHSNRRGLVQIGGLPKESEKDGFWIKDEECVIVISVPGLGGN